MDGGYSRPKQEEVGGKRYAKNEKQTRSHEES